MKKYYLPLIVLITILSLQTSFGQPPPPNNTCATAFVIESDTVCIEQTFTTFHATASDVDPGFFCTGIPDDDVWFRVEANSENLQILATGEGTFNATIQYFVDNCGSFDPLLSIPCADEAGPGETEVLDMNDLTLGQVYYFRVFDRGTIAGQTDFNFNLCVVEVPPVTINANNFPCVAIELADFILPTDGSIGFFDNSANGTLDGEFLIQPPSGVCAPDDFSGWCSDDPIQKSAWFSFVAPTDGAVYVDLCHDGNGTEFLTQLAIYSYTDCNDFNTFTFISGNEFSPFCALGSQLSSCSLNPGESYLLMVDGYQNAAGTFGISIDSIADPNAGTGSLQNVCKNTPSYDLREGLTDDAQFGGYWIDFDNTGQLINGRFNAEATPAGTYSFIYTVLGYGCFADDQTTVVVVTQPLPDAGEDGEVAVCTNAPAFELIDYLNGTPEAGGSWTDPSGASHSGNFDPAADPEGDYTYIIASSDIACPQDSNWAMVNVDILAEVNAGDNTTIAVCTNDAPFDMADSLDGNPDEGGQWLNPAFQPIDDIFDPATMPGGTYFYKVTALGCTDDIAVLTINMSTGPDAGQDSTAMICFDAAPVDLFTFLGGTPEVGGIWTDPSNNPTGNVFDPTIDTPGNYTYFVTGANCTPDSAVVTMQVEAEADAGDNNSVGVCIDNTGFNLFTTLGGNPQPGGEWEDPNGDPFDGFYVPVNDPPGNYTYIVNNNCSFAVAIVTVSVDELPDPGSNSNFTLCSDAPPIDLFLLLGGTPDTGGNWTAPDGAAHDGIYDASSDAEGAYWYHLAGGACGADSASVTITLLPLPFAGTPSSGTVTWNDNPSIELDTLLDNNDTGGDWTDDDGSGGLSGSTFTSTVAMNQNTYQFTYTVSNGCGSDASTVSVFVDQLIGIEELNNTQFQLYPNPASDHIIVRVEKDLGPVELYIYSIDGQQVYFDNMNIVKGVDNQVNLSLNPGSYILQCKNRDQILFTQNLLIQ